MPTAPAAALAVALRQQLSLQCGDHHRLRLVSVLRQGPVLPLFEGPRDGARKRHDILRRRSLLLSTAQTDNAVGPARGRIARHALPLVLLAHAGLRCRLCEMLR